LVRLLDYGVGAHVLVPPAPLNGRTPAGATP
jgi:hypothetical protein